MCAVFVRNNSVFLFSFLMFLDARAEGAHEPTINGNSFTL